MSSIQSEKSARALRCLDYHGTKNFWTIRMGTFAGDGTEFIKWRITGAACLSETVAFDVEGATLVAALERAFDAFSRDFVAEAEAAE